MGRTRENCSPARDRATAADQRIGLPGMLLTANGTVTSLLEACTGEPITTRTFHPQPDEQLVTPLSRRM
jgi:hypothetical protein